MGKADDLCGMRLVSFPSPPLFISSELIRYVTLYCSRSHGSQYLCPFVFPRPEADGYMWMGWAGGFFFLFFFLNEDVRPSRLLSKKGYNDKRGPGRTNAGSKRVVGQPGLHACVFVCACWCPLLVRYGGDLLAVVGGLLCLGPAGKGRQVAVLDSGLHQEKQTRYCPDERTRGPSIEIGARPGNFREVTCIKRNCHDGWSEIDR